MDFEENIDKIRIGFIGENIVRDIIKKKGNFRYTQIDMLGRHNGKWYTIEVKHQDMFTSPPFDGHGLPKYQIDMRMLLYEEKGIIPLFFVVDKKTQKVYYNSIIELEKGEKFTTKNKGRVIYPLTNFIEITD